MPVWKHGHMEKWLHVKCPRQCLAHGSLCAHIYWSLHTAISIFILGISFLVHLWRRCHLLNQLHEARVGWTQVRLNCSWPRRISEVPCGCCFPESQWGSSALRSPELSGLSHHSAPLKFSVLVVGKSGISPALIPKSFSFFSLMFLFPEEERVWTQVCWNGTCSVFMFPSLSNTMVWLRIPAH